MEVKELTDKLNFEAFGVKISVASNDLRILRKIRNILPQVIPENLHFKKSIQTEHLFEIEKDFHSDRMRVLKDGSELFKFTNVDRLLEYVSSQLRITVAEFAQSRVFIHAGAVGWKDSAIIIPGKSFSGKTTLVSELISLGAEYYSDEYAVLDQYGFLHPYPKTLSMRGIINDFDQVETPPDVFGAKIGKKNLPVKLVLLSEFDKERIWEPQILKPGEGMLDLLKHTIPIRFKPEFVLKVLREVSGRAVFAKCRRGDIKISAPLIIEFFETHCM